MCRTRIYKDRHERLGEVDVPSIFHVRVLRVAAGRATEGAAARQVRQTWEMQCSHMCLGSILEFARHSLSHFPAAGHSLLSLLFTLFSLQSAQQQTATDSHNHAHKHMRHNR